MTGRQVIVSGSRDGVPQKLVEETLNAQHAVTPITLLIHGDARGVDTFADEWANGNGVQRVRVPANWGKWGKRAGPFRNRLMLDLFPDAELIAFPGPESRGTEHAITEARMDGRDVTVVRP